MRSAGAGVGAAVGSALGGVKFGFNDFGNQLVRGTLTGLAAGTTAAVMRGGRISVQQVATDAFGNALGSSLASGSFSGTGQNEAALQGSGPWSERDYVNGMDLQSDNFSRNRQSQPYYDQIVGAFGGDAGPRYPGVQVADAGRLTLSGVTSDSDDAYYAGIIAKAQGRDVQRQAAVASGRRLDAQATTNLYASGAGDVRETTMPARAANGSYETGIYSNNPESAEYYRQLDGAYRIEINGMANTYTTGQLVQDFATGASHAVVGTVVQPSLQVLDMGLAAAAVGYNELIRPVSGGQMWLPEMRSDVATSYAQGTSQAKILASTLPVVNVGVFSYDTTTALMEGRTRDAARAAGGFMGGMAVGAGMQRYGNYGVQVGASGFGANGSNVRVSLIHPNLIGSGAKLSSELGGVPSGYQAHHLVMSDLASTSPALRYLAAKGLYDVNRASNGRGYPGNPLAAADSGLPLHSGFHGYGYRTAVARELQGLDQMMINKASDAALLA